MPCGMHASAIIAVAWAAPIGGLDMRLRCCAVPGHAFSRDGRSVCARKCVCVCVLFVTPLRPFIHWGYAGAFCALGQ